MLHYLLDVRLVSGGRGSYQGRVEVFYNGTWGRVCRYNWDLKEANVVCRQLGFQGALTAASSFDFGNDEGQFWMVDVRCTGNERSLTECDHRGWGTGPCQYGRSANVVCITGKCK